MIQDNDKVEQLILHAIVNWHEHMATLCYQEQGKHSYQFCPKRFIYGCACSFERKNIQKVLDTMVEIGTINQHTYPDHLSYFSYEITENSLNLN